MDVQEDAPLLVSPRPDWHKLSWMAEFVSNIPKYENNTVETVRLALAARRPMKPDMLPGVGAGKNVPVCFTTRVMVILDGP